MNESNEFLRYSCQINLPGFGKDGQEKLARARVLIVGMGGLGCPAAQYLVAGGIGTVGLADYDRVSVSNLHRQILYNVEDAGQLKVDVAAARLQKQNPQVDIVRHNEKVTSENVEALVDAYDMVIDCTDNFDARYLVNDAAVINDKSVIYGAIYQYEGQVSVWNFPNADGSRSPNYRDLFPEIDGTQIPNCAEGGVIPTLAGIIGCMQANEAIKLITGNEEVLAGKLLLFDALTMKSRVIKTGAVSQVRITEITQEHEVPLMDIHLAVDGGMFLVDVREHSERAMTNIGGLHIPLKELSLRIDEIPDDRDVVFYCASGKRSAEAVKLVQGKLLGRVYSLKDGLRPQGNQK